VDGIILTVDFQEGDEVVAGQPLFGIDPRPYRNAYDAALAVLARDSATEAHAKEELNRYEKLLKSRVVTEQDMAVQLTTASTAAASLRADQAAVATAKFNLDNTIIRAPIAGKTGSLLVRQGNLVRSGGAQPLVLINQVRPILVRFAIPSSQLPLVLQYGAKGGLPVTAVPGGIAPASPSIDSLAAAAMANPVQDAPAGPRGGNGGVGGGDVTGSSSGGQPAGSRGGFGPPRGPGGGAGGPDGPRTRSGAAAGVVAQQGAGALSATSGASALGGGERMMGKLTFIDNAVDTSTATVQLRARFDNSNGRLWAGQFAAMSLHLFDEDSALVVPTQAVVTGQRGTYVYIVDQSDTARQRAVLVERTAGNLSIIANGLRDGDRVVTEGQARLTPDSPVRLRTASDMGGDAGGGAGRGGRRGGRRGGGGGTDGARKGGGGETNAAGQTGSGRGQ
jgi:multidrug efflux system membrane fusion protein